MKTIKNGINLEAHPESNQPPNTVTKFCTWEAMAAMATTEVNNFHKILGHMTEESTKKTAKNLGMKLVGKLEHCKDCILAKMKQKNDRK